MDTLLLFVTVLSLASAFIAVMAVRKLKRQDQLRSEARVAALMSAADEPVNVAPAPAAVAAPRAASTAGVWNTVAGEMRWAPETPGIRETGIGIRSAREAQPLPKPDARIPAAESPVSSSERFFGTVQREQPASPRFAFAAAFALIVALVGAAIVFTSSSHAKTAAPVAQAAAASPLELISLGHSRDASSLTINGVVRNPSNGPKLEGLTAVVSLIDEHGGLISTRDVPLDYRAIGPGEEAPFKIMVPDPGSIARYRVSFRAGTDVVPHVDRRTDTKLASAL
jgi:hypothetical protein